MSSNSETNTPMPAVQQDRDREQVAGTTAEASAPEEKAPAVGSLAEEGAVASSAKPADSAEPESIAEKPADKKKPAAPAKKPGKTVREQQYTQREYEDSSEMPEWMRQKWKEMSGGAQ